MDTRLIIILILMLLSTILFTFKSNIEDIFALEYNPDSRRRFYTNIIQNGKGAPSFGWITNDTLIYLSPQAAFKICKEKTPTYIILGIFNKIQKHPLYLNDLNIAVAVATDREKGTYLLVNNTKWLFQGNDLTNCTYDYGIDENKVIYTTHAFLDNYPTTYVLD